MGLTHQPSLYSYSLWAKKQWDGDECPRVFLCLVPTHSKMPQLKLLFPSYPDEPQGCWISSIFLQRGEGHTVCHAGRTEDDTVWPASCSVHREGCTVFLYSHQRRGKAGSCVLWDSQWEHIDRSALRHSRPLAVAKRMRTMGSAVWFVGRVVPRRSIGYEVIPKPELVNFRRTVGKVTVTI